ncbi:MAG: DUF3450 domain-containing protein [Deltaproteobacteria bacterium]|nr:DUF3450 domain-containing protein [Deltaproteobacteria bacterium]
MFHHMLLLALAFIFIVAPASFGASRTEKVQKKMSQAIHTESKAQAKADDWVGQKDDLVNEIRDLQTRLTWLQYQKKKHEIYVQGVKDSIADLEARKLEARKLREGLEPYLEEVVSRLEAFVPEDLPFLEEERRQRLSFLKNTLNDYHLDLGEKLRRVYEALGVEATYGKMVTSSDETLVIDGSDTEVTVFRLGRMAMFYQTQDGKKIGHWNRQSGKWEPLSKDYAQVIRHALEMARRERTVQLIQLPLGAQ